MNANWQVASQFASWEALIKTEHRSTLKPASGHIINRRTVVAIVLVRDVHMAAESVVLNNVQWMQFNIFAVISVYSLNVQQ